MGICGALGKMNWTSSNLFRRRQFSASQILRRLYQRLCRVHRVFLGGLPASAAVQMLA